MPKAGNSFAAMLAVAIACFASIAAATTYDDADSSDKDNLERALMLCRWGPAHGAPDDAPVPDACTSMPVSMDKALLQMKQWWTFWFRRNSTEALKARDQFGKDVLAFHNACPR